MANYCRAVTKSPRGTSIHLPMRAGAMRERVDFLIAPNRNTSSSIHLPMRAGAMRERVDLLTVPNRDTSSSIFTLPMRAGAMRERVDILTAPTRDTSSSVHLPMRAGAMREGGGHLDSTQQGHQQFYSPTLSKHWTSIYPVYDVYERCIFE